MHNYLQVFIYVTQRVGMDVGSVMLYPISVMDDLVHQLGGWNIKLEC